MTLMSNTLSEVAGRVAVRNHHLGAARAQLAGRAAPVALLEGRERPGVHPSRAFFFWVLRC